MRFVLLLTTTLLRRKYLDLLRISLFAVFGTGALIYVASLGASLRGLLAEGSKEILGADLIASFSAPLTTEDLKWIDGLGFHETHERVFAAMVAVGASKTALRTQMHEVAGPYPLYVRQQAPQDRAAWNTLQQRPGVAVVERRFLLLTGARIGDALEFGRRQWTISATIDFVPGEISSIGRLDPAIYVAAEPGRPNETAETETVSALRHGRRIWFKTSDANGRAELGGRLTDYFSDGSISIETPERLQGRMERFIGRMDSFLRFSSNSALLLGLIGLTFAHALALRSEWEAARALVAIGATPLQLSTIYLALGAIALVAGALEGTGLALLVGSRLEAEWRQAFAFPAGAILHPREILSTLAAELPLGLLCLLGSTCFVQRSLGVARTGAATRPGTLVARLRGTGWAVTALVAAVAFAAGINDQRPLDVLAALAAGAAMLGAILLLLEGLGRLGRRSPYFALRCAAGRVRYDRWRTVLITSALAVAVAVSLAIYTASTMLMRQWGNLADQDVPTVALLNVAPADLDTARQALEKAGSNVCTIPLVAADLVGLLPDASGGRPTVSTADRRRLEKRSFTVTHKARLGPTEQVASGTFFGRGEAGDPVAPISISEKLAADGVHLGDRIVWNIGGVQLLSRVTSIRRVDFDRFYSGVAVVFPEGVIDDAPTTYVLTARGRDEEAVTAAITQVTRALPHIIGFDLTGDLAVMQELFGKTRAIVLPAAIIAWLLAAIISAGILATLRRDRRSEHATLGAMGASDADLLCLLVTEGGLIAAIATLVGAFPALWACRWVCARVLDIPAKIGLSEVLGGWAVVWLLLALAVSMAAFAATRPRNSANPEEISP